MSGIAAGIAGATIISGAISSRQQRKSADKASRIQKEAADAGIAEERRQFDEIRALLAPYVTAGNDATEAQRAFLGLLGPEKEREAIEGLTNSETFKSQVKEGETAILQNASATGGLRGGNTQRALAQFRPNLLRQVIAQRFAGLEGLAGRGQASAAGQAAAGQNSANAIAGLLQDQGAAIAGGELARGNAAAGFANTLTQAGGTLAGLYLNRPSNTIVPTPNAGGRNFVDPPVISAPQYGGAPTMNA